jgi:hypothetical protein
MLSTRVAGLGGICGNDVYRFILTGNIQISTDIFGRVCAVQLKIIPSITELDTSLRKQR